MATKTSTTSTKTVFELWQVKITGARNPRTGKFERNIEKFKRVRERVLITPEQASVLNYGIVEGDNTFCGLYYLPGEENYFYTEDNQ